MGKETRGRKAIPIIESLPYSSIIFLTASGINYPEAISKARKTNSSSTVKQLEALKNASFLNEPKKEKLLNKTIYSVNWKKIIEEFVKYLRVNVDYVYSENDRLGMNLDKIIRGFKERVEQARDKNFENSLKDNKLLYSFFEQYYSQLGRLKENWTIYSTFDFLSFFGDMNFIYFSGGSHNFYNLEKLFYFINNKEIISFPEWLTKEKKPETEIEQFERYKKIRNHTTEEFKQIGAKTQEQLNEVLHKHKEVTELFILSKILEIVKIKPSLQVGLNHAMNETGKKVFLQVFSKEQLKKYFILRSQYNLFSSIQEREQIQKDLKEILGENILQEIEESKQGIQKTENKKTKELREEYEKLKQLSTQKNGLEVTKPIEKGTTHSNPSSKKEDITK